MQFLTQYECKNIDSVVFPTRAFENEPPLENYIFNTGMGYSYTLTACLTTAALIDHLQAKTFCVLHNRTFV